jgi:hypothetical protein
MLKNNGGWGHSVHDGKNPLIPPLTHPNLTQTSPQNYRTFHYEIIGLACADAQSLSVLRFLFLD